MKRIPKPNKAKKRVSAPKAKVSLGADADRWLNEINLEAQIDTPGPVEYIMLGAGIGALTTWAMIAIAYLIVS